MKRLNVMLRLLRIRRGNFCLRFLPPTLHRHHLWICAKGCFSWKKSERESEEERETSSRQIKAWSRLTVLTAKSDRTTGRQREGGRAERLQKIADCNGWQCQIWHFPLISCQRNGAKMQSAISMSSVGLSVHLGVRERHKMARDLRSPFGCVLPREARTPR